MKEKISKETETSFSVIMTKEKGEGLVCSRLLRRHEFVCDYPGLLIGREEGENFAKQHPEASPYLFFFTEKGLDLCVDGSAKTGLGNLINHSRLQPNIEPKVGVVNNRPHVFFVVIASEIQAFQELLYDYGDHRKDVPWLSQS